MKNIFFIGFLCLGLVFILFAIPFLSGCSQKKEENKSDISTEIDLSKCTDISSDDLQKLIANGHKIQLLDVRSKGEFNNGHIPGALNILYQDVISSPDNVPGKDNTAIVVYCESGFRARKAQKALLKAGYPCVLHLIGDMAKWRSHNLPTEYTN